MFTQLDPWMIALVFAGAMLVSWYLGWRWAKLWPPPPHGEEYSAKFTDATMALLGLLLAFTFSMSLGRHDERRLAAVADSNAIGDFYTCASMLKEPNRSRLQNVVREYAQYKMDMARSSAKDKYPEKAIQWYQQMQSQMTALVGEALAGGTTIAVPLTNTLNNLTSCHAARMAAYRERLPWIIGVLLLLGSMIPAFLMGQHQGAASMARLSGTLSFFLLVTLVIYVTLDLNQPSSGLIRVNQETLERLIQSMAK